MRRAGSSLIEPLCSSRARLAVFLLRRRTQNEMLANATATRVACLAAADLVYGFCMGGCLLPNGGVAPGSICAARELACDPVDGIQRAACKAAYFGLSLGADLVFGSYKTEAQARNGLLLTFEQVQLGCGCPDGWEPFPQQSPPRWGDVECSEEFGRLGLPWPQPLTVW